MYANEGIELAGFYLVGEAGGSSPPPQTTQLPSQAAKVLPQKFVSDSYILSHKSHNLYS